MKNILHRGTDCEEYERAQYKSDRVKRESMRARLTRVSYSQCVCIARVHAKLG